MERNSSHDLRQDKRNRFLCQQIKENNSLAANSLIRENEGLIKKLAMSVEVAYELDETHYGGIDIDDLIQEGRIAMLKAATEYDFNVDIRFTTYAYTVMKNAMADLCRKSLSVYEKKMLDKGFSRIFIDSDKDEDGFNIEETITVDSRDTTGDTAVLHVQLQKMINRLVELSPRQRKVLVHHYGLDQREIRSIEETAEHFHLSTKFAGDIEGKALGILRKKLCDKKIV